MEPDFDIIPDPVDADADVSHPEVLRGLTNDETRARHSVPGPEPERYTSWNRSVSFRFLAGAIAIFFGFFLLGFDLIDRVLHGPDYDKNVISVPVATSEFFSTIAQIEEFYGITVEIADPVWTEQQIVILFNQVYDSLPTGLLPHLIAFYRDFDKPTIFTFQTPVRYEVAAVSISDAVRFDIRGFQRNHESIIHEIGHLLHFYLIHTDQDVEEEFTSLNGSFDYLGDAWRNQTVLAGGRQRVFISTYATSAFDEDFAETFRFIFRWPYAIYDGKPYADDVVAASVDPTSPLAQKISLMKDIVSRFE